MKLFVLVACIALTACTGVSQKLQNAIAFGTIEELNTLNPEIEKNLLLRLYRSPSKSINCFKETHGVCQYEYFLSVSSFDESPDTNIYKLKTKGEIIKIDWQNDTRNDSAKLHLIFNQYTSIALKNNKSLDAGKNTLRIEVNIDRILELN